MRSLVKSRKNEQIKHVLMSEREIQIECVEWFKENYKKSIIFSVPNEATYRRSTYYKPMGVLGGCSDLVLVMDTGDIIFIEMKAKGGYQTPEQKQFQEDIYRIGYKYYVVRSLDEFKYIMKHYRTNPPTQAEVDERRRENDKKLRKLQKQGISPELVTAI